jgi:hypothetical protein
MLSNRTINFTTRYFLGGLTLFASILHSGCAQSVAGQPSSHALAYAAAPSVGQCKAVGSKERELGLLAYRDLIESTQPVREEKTMGKAKVFYDRGVQINLASQPGLSAPWLARVVGCHMALGQAGQLGASNAQVDPLLVPGASAYVTESYTGYVISISARDADGSAEMARRVSALLEGGAGAAPVLGSAK